MGVLRLVFSLVSEMGFYFVTTGGIFEIGVILKKLL